MKSFYPKPLNFFSGFVIYKYKLKNITTMNQEYMTIECYDCHEVINFTEDDIIDRYYVVCPDCGQHLVILE